MLFVYSPFAVEQFEDSEFSAALDRLYFHIEHDIWAVLEYTEDPTCSPIVVKCPHSVSGAPAAGIGKRSMVSSLNRQETLPSVTQVL